MSTPSPWHLYVHSLTLAPVCPLPHLGTCMSRRRGIDCTNTMGPCDDWFNCKVDDWFNSKVDDWFNSKVEDWFNSKVDDWFNSKVDDWFNSKVDDWFNSKVDDWFNSKVDDWFNSKVDDWFNKMLMQTESLVRSINLKNNTMLSN